MPPEVNLSLRVWRIIALVSIICAVIFLSAAPQTANDFWLQAKVGELIAQTGEIPRTLLFPFTEVRNNPFNAHEWLPSLGFHALLQTVGEEGLPLVLGLLGLLLFALVTGLAWLRSGGQLALAMAIGLLALGAENFRHYLRPELLSLLLLLGLLILLERYRAGLGRPPLLSASLLTVVWANTHGSFILAPLITALFAFGDWFDRRHLAPWHGEAAGPALRWPWGVLLGCVALATLLTPFGWEQWAFVLGFSHENFARKYIIEWLSPWDPSFHQQRGFWIGLACWTFTLGMMVWRWRRVRTVDVLLMGLFSYLAFTSIRFFVYLGIAAAYALPPLLRAHAPSPLPHRAYAALAAAAVALLLLAARLGNAMGGHPHQSGINESFSPAMVKALADPAMQGRVYTSYALGAELVYRAYPRLQPSQDSRIDSYGESYFLYMQLLISNPQAMDDFLDTHDVRYMLLRANDFEGLKGFLIARKWNVLLADRRAILLERP